jgi:predicted component of type VI protein secretion system
MNRLLIVAILIISTARLFAQAQPAPAKLKTDAQKVVSIIRADKAKTQAYCQINSLGGEIDLAAQARDEQKADALTKKINDLEKQLSPEYLTLFDALNNADSNSKDFQDIVVRYPRQILSALTVSRELTSPTKNAGRRRALGELIDRPGRREAAGGVGRHWSAKICAMPAARLRYRRPLSSCSNA